MIDERTESLINRQLDGELTRDEQLELNKLLIRTPEARVLIEDYAKIDALAHQAIGQFCRRSEFMPALRARSRFTFFARGSAIAAGFILAAFVSVALFPRDHVKNAIVENKPSVEAPMIAALPVVRDLPQVLAIEGPRHERERVHKDLLGVFDQETQSVYLLELDRQQTTVVPVSMNY